MLPLEVFSKLVVRFQKTIQDGQSTSVVVQRVNQRFEAVFSVEVVHEFFILLEGFL